MNTHEIAESAPGALSVTGLELPSIVRYIDDYTEESYSFSDFDCDIWPIHTNGSTSLVSFETFSCHPNLLKITKCFACNLLLTVSSATTRNYVQGLSLISVETLEQFLICELSACRRQWDVLLAQQNYFHSYQSLKSFLKYAALNRIGSWSPSYISFISSSMPLPSRDKYAAVRSGDVFIDLATETKIVRWIYEVSLAVTEITYEELVDCGLLICSYQFAMRPKQIGLLRQRDVRVYISESGDNSVHLTFHMLKQRSGIKKQTPLVRKVKREWAKVFTELSSRTDSNGGSLFFGMPSPENVATRLRSVIAKITGRDWTATDLRHSGAMRQVDAGANAEELAEFMGHSSLDSGMVYYDTSSTQAERVNQALGISQTYMTVAQVGHQGFISPNELATLKGENQIAGVPHGIPISGVGACTTGQPSCPYNPITACYGCPKFIATADLNIHEQVLSDFRNVVQFFFSASRGENQSPAYMQLRQTINEVQLVIHAIRNNNNGKT